MGSFGAPMSGGGLPFGQENVRRTAAGAGTAFPSAAPSTGVASNQYFSSLPGLSTPTGSAPNPTAALGAAGGGQQNQGLTGGVPVTSPAGAGGGVQEGVSSLGHNIYGTQPIDPALSNQFMKWLQTQVGKGATPYGGTVNLPGGGKTAPGQLAAPIDPVLAQLSAALTKGQAGGSPGLATELEMAKTGAPTDVGPAWEAMKAAQERNIKQGAGALREQFAFGGDLASSPFGQSMADYEQQSRLSQNALLAQMQQQASEAAAGRRAQAGQYMTQAQQELGTLFQGMDQAAIQAELNEFIRTQPEYGPLLNMLYGQANTFPPTQQQKSGQGVLGALIGSAGSLYGIGKDIYGKITGKTGSTPTPGGGGAPGGGAANPQGSGLAASPDVYAGQAGIYPSQAAGLGAIQSGGVPAGAVPGGDIGGLSGMTTPFEGAAGEAASGAGAAGGGAIGSAGGALAGGVPAGAVPGGEIGGLSGLTTPFEGSEAAASGAQGAPSSFMGGGLENLLTGSGIGTMALGFGLGAGIPIEILNLMGVNPFSNAPTKGAIKTEQGVAKTNMTMLKSASDAMQKGLQTGTAGGIKTAQRALDDTYKNVSGLLAGYAKRYGPYDPSVQQKQSQLQQWYNQQKQTIAQAQSRLAPVDAWGRRVSDVQAQGQPIQMA